MATTNMPCAPGNHLGLTGLTEIVSKHLTILHASKKPSLTTPGNDRRPKHLRDLLVHSALITPAPSTNTGNNKCNNRWCKCCQEMVSRNGDKQHIRKPDHCRKCGLQYVGEIENALHVRMNDTILT